MEEVDSTVIVVPHYDLLPWYLPDVSGIDNNLAISSKTLFEVVVKGIVRRFENISLDRYLDLDVVVDVPLMCSEEFENPINYNSRPIWEDYPPWLSDPEASKLEEEVRVLLVPRLSVFITVLLLRVQISLRAMVRHCLGDDVVISSIELTESDLKITLSVKE